MLVLNVVIVKEEELPALESPKYFKRFEITESGISPRTIPGMKNGLFLSTGLEHNEEGKPAEAPSMHVAQTDKRSVIIYSSRCI